MGHGPSASMFNADTPLSTLGRGEGTWGCGRVKSATGHLIPGCRWCEIIGHQERRVCPLRISMEGAEQGFAMLWMLGTRRGVIICRLGL